MSGNSNRCIKACGRPGATEWRVVDCPWMKSPCQMDVNPTWAHGNSRPWSRGSFAWMVGMDLGFYTPVILPHNNFRAGPGFWNWVVKDEDKGRFCRNRHVCSLGDRGRVWFSLVLKAVHRTLLVFPLCFSRLWTRVSQSLVSTNHFEVHNIFRQYFYQSILKILEFLYLSLCKSEIYNPL